MISKLLDLPAPHLKDIADFFLDEQALRAAVTLKRAFIDFASKIEPETLMAFAVQRFPGASRMEALGTLATALADASADVGDFNKAVREAWQERDEAIKPIFSKAVARHFEILNILAGIPRRIDLANLSIDGAIKALKDAGASEADARRIVEEKQIGRRVEDIQRERAALIVENEKIAKFIRTKNLVDLPETFILPTSDTVTA